MKREVIVSLDIGGTNCRIGLVDKEHVLYEQKIHSTCELTERGFMDELVKLLLEYLKCHEEQYCFRAVTLGFPSTIDRSRKKLISTPNIEGLDNLPVVEILTKKLKLPVYLERDVNLLLLYDMDYLKLPADATVVGIYFGTGIGNALYLDGKLWYGRNGVAGELGHIPQLYSHTECGCGNHSCIEPLGGGKCLEQLCEKTFPGTPIGELYTQHGNSREMKEQVEAMAVPVASEINILDPEYIILGGGLLQMKDFPTERLEQLIYQHTRKPYPAENLRFLYSKNNQENGIIGAGIYGWRKWNEENGQ